MKWIKGALKWGLCGALVLHHALPPPASPSTWLQNAIRHYTPWPPACCLRNGSTSATPNQRRASGDSLPTFGNRWRAGQGMGRDNMTIMYVCYNTLHTLKHKLIALSSSVRERLQTVLRGPALVSPTIPLASIRPSLWVDAIQSAADMVDGRKMGPPHF